jgi:hypothetical protein
LAPAGSVAIFKAAVSRDPVAQDCQCSCPTTPVSSEVARKVNMPKQREILTRLIVIGVLFLAPGCTNLSASNVGEPTGIAKYRFYSSLRQVHVGMPSDSLEILFSTATKAGEAGILHTSRIITEEFTRETCYLGWCTNPKHQIGLKDDDELEKNIARIHIEDHLVTEIEILD